MQHLQARQPLKQLWRCLLQRKHAVRAQRDARQHQALRPWKCAERLICPVFEVLCGTAEQFTSFGNQLCERGPRVHTHLLGQQQPSIFKAAQLPEAATSDGQSPAVCSRQ
jgi:hypothetical protein